MNHKEFLAEVQKSCHADHSQCITLLSALLKLMVKAAVDQIPVTIHGLGTFTSHKHPEYIQENPQTGEQILFPPRISYRMQAESSDNTGEAKTIASELAEFTQLPLDVTESFLKAMATIINTHLQQHEEVEVHGLGIFHVIETHQAELQRIAFNPDEMMRELVNAPFNCFEPVVIKEANPVPAVEPVASVTEVMDVSESIENTELPNSEPESSEPLVNTVPDTELIVETEPEEEPTIEQQPISSVEPDTANSVEPETVNSVEPEPVDSSEVVTETETPQKMETSEETQSETSEESEPAPEVPVETKPVSEPLLDKEEKSSNTLLYAALSLIVLACASLVIYLFVLDSDNEVSLAEEYAEVAPVVTETLVAEVVAEDTLIALSADTLSVSAQEGVLPVQTDISSSDPSETFVRPSEPKAVSPQQSSESKSVEPQKTASEPAKPVAKPVEPASPKPAEPVAKPAEPKTFHRLMGADGQPVTVTLNPGERLTIVSLNQYGDKAFWPYIYEVNSDKIKAPNLVQAGMKLYLPDPAYYHIDANNEESLRKAKNRGAQLLK